MPRGSETGLDLSAAFLLGLSSEASTDSVDWTSVGPRAVPEESHCFPVLFIHGFSLPTGGFSPRRPSRRGLGATVKTLIHHGEPNHGKGLWAALVFTLTS